MIVKDKIKGAKSYFIILENDTHIIVTKEEFMVNQVGKPFMLESEVEYKSAE